MLQDASEHGYDEVDEEVEKSEIFEQQCPQQITGLLKDDQA